MLCSVQAQARRVGPGQRVNIVHRNTDAAGQLEDIRNLIAAGVDAILVNPSDPSARRGHQGSHRRRHRRRRDRPPVTEPTAYILSNDQAEYGYLGAEWLFEQLGGAGNVVLHARRSPATRPTTTATPASRRRSRSTRTSTSSRRSRPAGTAGQAAQQITDLIASGLQFDGVWTSGIDNVIVEAFKKAGVPFVPIVGADNGGLRRQLLDRPATRPRRARR